MGDEVFEKQNCLLFKPSKCKVILQNLKEENAVITLDGEVLEIVDEHKYLGTLVESDSRRSDVQKRISECKGVLNEIVELCKTDAVMNERFKYMFTLLNSCFMLKFKHGCEEWDEFSAKERKVINGLIPQAVKRVLELPRSTPTNAVKHDFGLIDLTSEVEMEKILLASNVYEMNDERIVKRLLLPMMQNEVPGYCTQLKNILVKYETTISDLNESSDKRKMMKKKLVVNETRTLLHSMMAGSKTDGIAANYSYDGRMMGYLNDLPFEEGRIIFIFRCRMFPTRVNFPGRWTANQNCVYCGHMDTDQHLFECWGYVDLVGEKSVEYGMFFKTDTPIADLSEGAKVLAMMYDRLSTAQNDAELGGKRVEI